MERGCQLLAAYPKQTASPSGMSTTTIRVARDVARVRPIVPTGELQSRVAASPNVGSAALFVVVALLATALPAFRALSIDPLVALRRE